MAHSSSGNSKKNKEENLLCIIYCYFGPFPNYFNLWMQSAGNNSNIDFYLFTDNNEPTVHPKNVFYVKSSLREISLSISSHFQVDAQIKNAYKLCDLKPFFYLLLGKLGKVYKYWGFGDLDVVLGSLDPLLSIVRTDHYDAFFETGHLQIIRNAPKINEIVEEIIGAEACKTVITAKDHYGFDEYRYCRAHLLPKERTFLDNSSIADIQIKLPYLRIVGLDVCHMVFTYNSGVLTGHYLNRQGEIVSNDYLYIHLQKRAMKEKTHGQRTYLITATSFLPWDGFPLDRKMLRQCGKSDARLTIKYRFLYYRWLFLQKTKKGSLPPFHKWLHRERPLLQIVGERER